MELEIFSYLGAKSKRSCAWYCELRLKKKFLPKSARVRELAMGVMGIYLLRRWW